MKMQLLEALTSLARVPFKAFEAFAYALNTHAYGQIPSGFAVHYYGSLLCSLSTNCSALLLIRDVRGDREKNRRAKQNSNSRALPYFDCTSRAESTLLICVPYLNRTPFHPKLYPLDRFLQYTGVDSGLGANSEIGREESEEGRNGYDVKQRLAGWKWEHFSLCEQSAEAAYPSSQTQRLSSSHTPLPEHLLGHPALLPPRRRRKHTITNILVGCFPIMVTSRRKGTSSWQTEEAKEREGDLPRRAMVAQRPIAARLLRGLCWLWLFCLSRHLRLFRSMRENCLETADRQISRSCRSPGRQAKTEIVALRISFESGDPAIHVVLISIQQQCLRQCSQGWWSPLLCLR